jgi:hypothetical protein
MRDPEAGIGSLAGALATAALTVGTVGFVADVFPASVTDVGTCQLETVATLGNASCGGETGASRPLLRQVQGEERPVTRDDARNELCEHAAGLARHTSGFGSDPDEIHEYIRDWEQSESRRIAIHGHVFLGKEIASEYRRGYDGQRRLPHLSPAEVCAPIS